MSYELAQALVERGMALLDEKVPNWFEDINTESLDMSDGCCCVLAQLESGGRINLDESWHGHRPEGRLFNGPYLRGGMALGLNPFGRRVRSYPEVLDLPRAAEFGFADIDEFDGVYDAEEQVTYAELQDAWLVAITKRKDNAHGA